MEHTRATVEELRQLVADKRKELHSLRFSAQGSKNRNVKLQHTLRKDVARALTALTQLTKGHE